MAEASTVGERPYTPEAKAAPMTGEETYEAMARYLVDNGWRREQQGSGWWWKPDAPESDDTIGGAVEQQLLMDGLDLRVLHRWEPEEFWGE